MVAKCKGDSVKIEWILNVWKVGLITGHSLKKLLTKGFFRGELLHGFFNLF